MGAWKRGPHITLTVTQENKVNSRNNTQTLRTDRPVTESTAQNGIWHVSGRHVSPNAHHEGAEKGILDNTGGPDNTFGL